nr:ferrous iron transport protein B [Candidatus Njordarchaeum guaymaensis]
TKSVELQLGLVVLLALINRTSRLSIRQVAGIPYHEIRYVGKPCEKRAQWLEQIKGIGRVLKRARESAGLTQLEVVRDLGWKAVKGAHISALENERRNITKQFLRRLVKVYRKYSNRENPALSLMENLAFSDVVWDHIKGISDVDTDDGYVYDLTVEDNENFMLANGIFIHNSVIYNHLTGLHQHIGNWPGKTVERAEGTLHFKGYTIDVVDLPGIYSFSTFSMEELVSREYIICEKPDIVINVVDATLLERNLFFTLQLMELDAPLIIALNQMDLARRKGIKINLRKLEQLLGVPVVPTVAVKGIGIYKLLDKALRIIEKERRRKRRQDGDREKEEWNHLTEGEHKQSKILKHGEEIEKRIGKLTEELRKYESTYPERFMAVKLLEGDSEITRETNKVDHKIVSNAKVLAKELEGIHGHSCSTVITSERYEMAGSIARDVQEIRSPMKPLIEERLHNITTNRIIGYPLMLMIFISIFYAVFTFGGFLSDLLTNFFYGWRPVFEGLFGLGIASALAWGVMEGLIAAVTVALPYIIPFYIMLYILEDSGYINRIAFLMDKLMHKMGLHGKAFVPMMLAYGCNVPACLGCRILETKRERLLAAFVTTLVPCAARTVVILGLVGAFVGIQWALFLYALNLVIVFLLGRVAFKALPGEPTALMMEMPDYKLPHMRTVLKQTWFGMWEFIKIAMPIVIAGSFMIKLIEVAGLLGPITEFFSPVTVLWLGLPALAGVALIFGILRKELTLVMLATVLGTTNFALVMTPEQMIVFTIVVLFYVPCLATIAVLGKEFGWKKALFITVVEILFATFLGGIALRVLTPFI